MAIPQRLVSIHRPCGLLERLVKKGTVSGH
jgi:hypothetical protein